ncbi:MAG TPA: DUF6062 family protein, partial [Thermodesulfobacteriota bacterium]|nr:DUF6062 family protein [Thermodesulfobacteriota bacterium]
ETEFDKKFRDSDGICFPHLITSIEEYPAHDNLPHLISRQIEKFESLGKELNDFIRKQYYQYANEPRGTEVDSWKRALEMAVGKKAIPRGG